MKNIIASLCLVASAGAMAQAPQQYDSKAHNIPFAFDGYKTITGQQYQLPQQPRVVSKLIILQPKQQLPAHLHHAPFFATVLEGTLRVNYGKKGHRTYKPMTGYVEALDYCHEAQVVGDEPVKLHVLMIVPQDNPRQADTLSCDME